MLNHILIHNSTTQSDLPVASISADEPIHHISRSDFTIAVESPKVRRNTVQGSTAACRYPAISTFVRHKQLWPLHREDNPLELGPHPPRHNTTPHNMRFTSIVSAFALLFSAASALEKPLNIEVTKAVECTRKTESGKRHPRQSSPRKHKVLTKISR